MRNLVVLVGLVVVVTTAVELVVVAHEQLHQFKVLQVLVRLVVYITVVVVVDQAQSEVEPMQTQTVETELVLQ